MNEKLLLVPKPQSVEYGEENTGAEILTSILYEQNPQMKEEEYKISITAESARVEYGDAEAKYRAETTLAQISAQASDGKLPCVEIHDYPSIKNRGLMLDVSRGKMPVMSELKKLVDLMSGLKYNQLQLYMDDFVFEYKNFPEYHKDTEPYTKADIKELQEYCGERFIELVPNQNGFGHMENWLAKSELTELGIVREDGKSPNTLNPLDERSMELVDSIYDGFLDIFDSEYVNVGMDEPVDLGKSQTKDECEKIGKGRVYTDYLNKICKLVAEKYNKTPMFWDDIVFKHEEELKNISKDVIVMEWGYEGEQKFDRHCERLKQEGLRFYVCPGTSSWGSYTGRFNNMVFNIAAAAESGAHYGADGFLLTEWGDGGNPQFPTISLFPYVFGAAYSWNSGSADTETAYAERCGVIESCEAYLDRFIYKSEEKGSLSRIINSAGKFYLLEKNLLFNGTLLNREFYNAIEDRETNIDVESTTAVAEYAESILRELAAFAGNEYADEAILNCRMVCAFAKGLAYLGGGKKADGLNAELGDIIEEYKRLWQKKNKLRGMELFVNKIEIFRNKL